MSSKFALLRVTCVVACLSSLAGCVMPQTVNHNGPAFGALPGYGEVLSGNAVYRMDVTVPPGRTDATPSVPLEYSSAAGNGSLGMGWYIALGSSVARCPKTLRSDGYSNGVHLDPDDGFCVNGLHLELTSGKYGKSGSIYHTQVDTNDEVELHGDPQQADSYWIITFHDGKRDYLRQPVTMPGSSVPRAWYMTVHETFRGDTYELHYDTSRPGEVLLSEVTYDGRDNNGVFTPGTRSIRFEYEDRPDPAIYYYAGTESRDTRRLKGITVNMPSATAPGGMVQLFNYHISYEQSLATGRSLLSSVTYCGVDAVGVSQCLPPTSFTWENEPNSFDKPVKYPVPMQDAHLSPLQMMDAANSVQAPYMLTGDVDGDGRRELFYYRPGVGAHLYFLNADGSVRKDVDVTDFFQTRANARFQLYTADVDNDGAQDLPGNVDGHLAFQSWTGSDMGKPQVTSIPYSTGMSLVDVDGDGETDVVQPEPVKAGSQDYGLYLYRNLDSKPGHLAFAPRQLLAPVADAHDHFQVVGGFTGDLPAVLVSSDTKMEKVILLRQGPDRTLHAQVVTPESLGMPNRSFRQQTYYADINGDGLYDMVYSDAGAGKPATWHYQLNTGGRFAAPVDTQVADERPQGVAMTGVVVGDLDGSHSDQLLYPDTLVTPFCMGESHTAKGNYTTDDYVCSEQMQQADPWEDLGIYRYAVLKFKTAADGSLKPVIRHDSGIVAQANLATVGDIAGDGSNAVMSPFSPWFANGHFKDATGKYVDCPADFGCGLQVAKLHGANHAEGLDRAQDVIVKVVNGVGAVLSWDYYPMDSTRAGLYKVQPVGSAGRYLGPHRVFIDAPATVVGSYAVSNGPKGIMATHVEQYGDAIYDPAGGRLVGYRWMSEGDNTTGKRVVRVYDRRFPLDDAVTKEWKEPSNAVDDMTADKPGSDQADLTLNTWECIGPAPGDAGCSVHPGTSYFTHAVHQTRHQFDTTRKVWTDSDVSYTYDENNNSTRGVTKTTDPTKVETVTDVDTYRSNPTNNWMRHTIAQRDIKDVTDTVGGDDKSTQSVTTKETKDTMEFDSHNRMTKKTSETDKPTNSVESFVYLDDPSSPAVGQVQTFSIAQTDKKDGTVDQLITAHLSYSTDGYYQIAAKANDKDYETSEYDLSKGLVTHTTKDGLDTTPRYDAFGRMSSLAISKGGKTLNIDYQYEPCDTDCPAGAVYKRVDTLNGSVTKVVWYNVRNEPMNDPYK